MPVSVNKSVILTGMFRFKATHRSAERYLGVDSRALNMVRTCHIEQFSINSVMEIFVNHFSLQLHRKLA
jgi:hypothetical protein